MRGFHIFPELSNSASPPAEPVVYLGLIIQSRIIESNSSFNAKIFQCCGGGETSMNGIIFLSNGLDVIIRIFL